MNERAVGCDQRCENIQTQLRGGAEHHENGASQGPTARVAPPRQSAVTTTSGSVISASIHCKICGKVTTSVVRQLSRNTDSQNQPNMALIKRRRVQRLITAMTGSTGQA